jgi:hypothetical protein
MFPTCGNKGQEEWDHHELECASKMMKQHAQLANIEKWKSVPSICITHKKIEIDHHMLIKSL